MAEGVDGEVHGVCGAACLASGSCAAPSAGHCCVGSSVSRAGAGAVGPVRQRLA